MFKQGCFIRDHTLTYVLEQTNRAAVLESVKATRIEHPVKDRPGLGRWALSVPLEDWVRLRRTYPDLAAKDAQIRSVAWTRFMQSAESEPYRMRDRI